jgi:hypothetical protein
MEPKDSLAILISNQKILANSKYCDIVALEDNTLGLHLNDLMVSRLKPLKNLAKEKCPLFHNIWPSL